MTQHPDLLAVHGALSALVHAVDLTLKDVYCEVIAEWRQGTYLSVQIEVKEKSKQLVIDRLAHGALVGGYDYRFSLSYPTSVADPDEWVTVTAYPDMHHDRRRLAA